MINIEQATIDNLDILTELFDNYRVFYRAASDRASSKAFLSERLDRKEAIIFLAANDKGEAMGFTLLYPTFSSVSQGRVFVLNDLFVQSNHRRKGVAAALLNHAAKYGKENGAIRLHLETEVSNEHAQALYEKEGWVKESDTYHYNYNL